MWQANSVWMPPGCTAAARTPRFLWCRSTRRPRECLPPSNAHKPGMAHRVFARSSGLQDQGDIRPTLDPFDLLLPLVSVSNLASIPEWPQSKEACRAHYGFAAELALLILGKDSARGHGFVSDLCGDNSPKRHPGLRDSLPASRLRRINRSIRDCRGPS
jgi:hypothetical protein